MLMHSFSLSLEFHFVDQCGHWIILIERAEYGKLNKTPGADGLCILGSRQSYCLKSGRVKPSLIACNNLLFSSQTCSNCQMNHLSL